MVLEQDITKKKPIDENITELDFRATNNKEYKVETIWNNIVYRRKSKMGYFL